MREEFVGGKERERITWEREEVGKRADRKSMSVS